MCIVELGGTTGDIESAPFIESDAVASETSWEGQLSKHSCLLDSCGGWGTENQAYTIGYTGRSIRWGRALAEQAAAAHRQTGTHAHVVGDDGGSAFGIGGQRAGQRPDVICQRFEVRPRLIDLRPGLRRRTQRGARKFSNQGRAGACAKGVRRRLEGHGVIGLPAVEKCLEPVVIFTPEINKASLGGTVRLGIRPTIRHSRS